MPLTMLQTEVTKALLRNLQNFHLDNHDSLRYGRSSYQRNIVRRFGFMLIKYLSSRGVVLFRDKGMHINQRFNDLSNHFGALEETYRSLENADSRELLVELLAYYILGEYRVKLSINNGRYWKALRELQQLASTKDVIIAPYKKQPLRLFDLASIGVPIRMYYTAKGILNDFVLRQYEYRISGDNVIRAEAGETVIDAGGCYGDTALYFANQVGRSGSVFVFEFIPSNVEVALKNIALNPEVNSIIQLVKHPLWDVPAVPMYFIDKGPGSKVSFEEIGDGRVLTESIDSFVVKQGLESVDFIKMDIEGAEMRALRGAEKTITKFKPKLAISVYHSVDDLHNVPQFIKSIDERYRLYLGHYTIHKEETVLFAVID